MHFIANRSRTDDVTPDINLKIELYQESPKIFLKSEKQNKQTNKHKTQQKKKQKQGRLFDSAAFDSVLGNSFRTKLRELILYYSLDFFNSFKSKLSWQTNISE